VPKIFSLVFFFFSKKTTTNKSRTPSLRL